MLRIRDQSIEELDLDAIQVANNYIHNQKKLEKKQKVHDTIKKELDLGCRWLGVRQLKRPYQPIPYIFKDRTGKRIRYRNRAEAAADHSANIWKRPKLEKYDPNIETYGRGKRPKWICKCGGETEEGSTNVTNENHEEICWLCKEPRVKQSSPKTSV